MAKVPQRGEAREHVADGTTLLDGGKVLDFRVEPVAYRLYSRSLDREIWVCQNDQTAGEIAAEFPGVPVLTFAEVPKLKGKPVDLLRVIMDTKAEFVGARLRS